MSILRASEEDSAVTFIDNPYPHDILIIFDGTVDVGSVENDVSDAGYFHIKLLLPREKALLLLTSAVVQILCSWISGR
ncbi:Hypothetical protein AT6N2_L0963 [Agrobacterium tumefaciens]|nr:Hypothetical protein AT6N2_L0963 [Agrobacterium tumefaciens]